MTNFLNKLASKGFRLQFRWGKPPFNPHNQVRTDPLRDIAKKDMERKEQDEHKATK